jgi:hypothetical protein
MSGMKNLTVSKAARAGEQLLRSPAPQPDESLMGYILRLAESNCYETPKWILELAGLLTCAGNGALGIGRASVSVAVAVIGVRPYALNYRRRSVGPCASYSRRFIPIEEAGKRMGLSREWVKFHVSTGFLRASGGVSDPQTTLIDAKSVDYFLRARIQILTTRTTAAELGITAKELFDLIAYGHLKIAGGPQIDGCPETVIDAESLIDLCRHVERMSALTSETALELLLEGGSGELMSFDQVREQLQEKNLNLERFAFRHDQIQQYIARLCPKPKIPIPAEPPNNS